MACFRYQKLTNYDHTSVSSTTSRRKTSSATARDTRSASRPITATSCTGFRSTARAWTPSVRRSRLGWRRRKRPLSLPRRRSITASSSARSPSKRTPTPCSKRSRPLDSQMRSSNTLNKHSFHYGFAPLDVLSIVRGVFIPSEWREFEWTTKP